MPVVTHEQWLGLKDELTPEEQAEALQDDTLGHLQEWLNSRITARKTRLKFAAEQQSANVLASAGTLEGYDG